MADTFTEARRCGYTVINKDGIEEPCDRPAEGWRWYQDVEHEDSLDVACYWHRNEGGQRMAELAAERDRARDIAVALEQQLAEIRRLCEQARQSRHIPTGYVPIGSVWSIVAGGSRG